MKILLLYEKTSILILRSPPKKGNLLIYTSQYHPMGCYNSIYLTDISL